ncbi:MAG: ATP-dependent sacrificial sulfur transferase LarE [Ruminococcus sp.]|nr:ATP-dependent sacrificial sulfur transferase LarE [Ruminococcus sp.]
MELKDFFGKYPKAAVAFSGGADSAYLMYAAMKAGADIRAYYVKSEFQPRFEEEDAKRLSGELGCKMTVIPLEVLPHREIAANTPDRCYFCKRRIFGSIAAAALKDGYSLLLDGTNSSDDSGDRPGMRALKELHVLSPLRECGLAKDEIRRLSKEAGLFTWDKPAYACLATRIQQGETITKEKLHAAEAAESYLFSLGFKDFRVRTHEGSARLQVKKEQLEKAIYYREEILRELKKYYNTVSLDMEVRE